LEATFTYDRFGNRNFDAGNTTILSPLTNLVVDPVNVDHMTSSDLITLPPA
jgi:hypothetical protein